MTLENSAKHLVHIPVAHIDLLPTPLSGAKKSLPKDHKIGGVDFTAVSYSRYQWFRELGSKNPISEFRSKSSFTPCCWKLQITDRPVQQWLFDLENDPTEQNNLLLQYPQKVQELRDLMDRYASVTRTPLYGAEIEVPTAVDKHLARNFYSQDEWVSVPN